MNNPKPSYWSDREHAFAELWRIQGGIIDASLIHFQHRSDAQQIIQIGRVFGMLETVRFHELYLDSQS